MKPKLLTTLKDYSFPDFLRDSAAGLTVAMIAIPLSLAIAITSGAPPETGLITAAIGGFLISLLGGSRVQIGGPTGAFIVVVYSIIQDHGYDGLVLAALMAGVILVIAGYLRAAAISSPRTGPRPGARTVLAGFAAWQSQSPRESQRGQDRHSS